MPIKIKNYTQFNESVNSDYSILDFYEYLRNNSYENTDISQLVRWTDHFVGEGWWNKIKSHVDRMFEIFSEVDLVHIESAMLDIFDTLSEEKEKGIYCAVLYGSYGGFSNRVNDSNELKFNGTIGVFNFMERPQTSDSKRKSYILHKIIFEIIKPTVSYGLRETEVNFRKTPEAEFVTDKKWQCQNFDFSPFTELRDHEMRELKLYSPEVVLESYQPGVVIDIGSLSSTTNRQTGGMSLLAIEKELDERIDLITANLDYEDILWPFSRKKRYFDTSQPIYDYTLKILLKM